MIFVLVRNSENSIGMRERSNGLRAMASPDKVGSGHDKRHNHQKTNNDDANNHHGAGGGGSASSETAHDNKKGGGGGGSSSGSDAIPMVWPPKFVIGLTNKEKEEDFMAIKGSKLPQRPKKRAKLVQRTLNVSFYFSIILTILLDKNLPDTSNFLRKEIILTNFNFAIN